MALVFAGFLSNYFRRLLSSCERRIFFFKKNVRLLVHAQLTPVSLCTNGLGFSIWSLCAICRSIVYRRDQSLENSRSAALLPLQPAIGFLETLRRVLAALVFSSSLHMSSGSKILLPNMLFFLAFSPFIQHPYACFCSWIFVCPHDGFYSLNHCASWAQMGIACPDGDLPPTWTKCPKASASFCPESRYSSLETASDLGETPSLCPLRSRSLSSTVTALGRG